MTTWHPATTATMAQAVKAQELLKSSLADGSWSDGKVLLEENGTRYVAHFHPNKDDAGHHPGVEVWLPEAAPMATTAPTPATDNERELVLQEGERRGWPREELNAAIAIESGWNPAAHNVQGFGGLIGFSPGFARKWVGSPQALWALSVSQQAPLVGKYLDGVAKRWRVPGDTYLAVGAPAFVGASDSTIVYQRGTKAWEQNPGWRGPDGEITAGSMRALLLRKMNHLAGGRPTPTPKELPPLGSGLQGLEFLLQLRSAMAHELSYAHLEGVPKSLLAQYQAEHGLRIDGVLGPATLGSLIAEIERGKAPATIPAPPASPIDDNLSIPKL